jgi:hypothetical protein
MYGASSGSPGEMSLITNGATGNGFNFTKYSAGTYSDLMRIQRDGKVRIGSASMTTPGTYKLYVEDGIMTERVRVAIKNSNDWMDQVFAENYNLRSVDELSSYIKEHQHLPEIPSADEVVAKGIDVGEMNAKLLKKIEELTLYMIAQQKEIEGLKKELEKIK